MLLILSVRREALPVNPDLRKWLLDLGGKQTVTRLELNPLASEHTAQLVQQLAITTLDVTRRGKFIDYLSTEWGYYAWHPQEAKVNGEQALALAQQLEQPELIGRSHNILAHLALITSQWQPLLDQHPPPADTSAVREQTACATPRCS